MKRLLRWLVRLYPRSWRDRYESEVCDLLDAAEPRWRDAFDLLKEVLIMRLSHLGPVSTTLLGGAIATLLTVAVLQLKPVQWESQAILSIRILSPWSPESRNPDLTLVSMSQEALWKPALLQIVEKERLYPDLRTKGLADKAMDRLRKNITVTPVRGLYPAGTMFAVAFRDRDPYVANQVTRDLANAFEDQTVQSFTRLLSTGIPPELARKPAVRLEFFYPATHSPTNWSMVIGLALAEGLQLGFMFALLRKRGLAARASS